MSYRAQVATPISFSLIGLAAGALFLSACATYQERDALNFGTRISADLSGANELGQSGDANGAGEFVAALNRSGRMCYELEANGVDLVTAAHIHEGTAQLNGKVVAPLVTPQMNRRAKACTELAPELARRILADPSAFYVNLHNAAHPNGAVRGQLNLP